MEELSKGSVLALTRLSILLGLTTETMQSGVHVLHGCPLALVDRVTDNTGATIERIQ